MELIQWKPFGTIDRFLDDQLFLSFSRLYYSDMAVDVFEEKGNVIAKMSLSGIKPEELDIAIEDDLLTISGRREEEKETEKKDYYCKEIRRGSFSRSVSLSKSVDASKAHADYQDGVLMVTMPIVAGAKEKAVKIAVRKK